MPQHDSIIQNIRQATEKVTASQAAANVCAPSLAEAPKEPSMLFTPAVTSPYMTVTPMVAAVIRHKEICTR